MLVKGGPGLLHNDCLSARETILTDTCKIGYCLTKQITLSVNELSANLFISLRWRHNGCESVSKHQPHHCLFNRLFRCRSKKTSKPRVIGLCVGNSPGTGEFPAQVASDTENVSIWWRHHVFAHAHLCVDHFDIIIRRIFILWPRLAFKARELFGGRFIRSLLTSYGNKACGW